MLYLKSLQAAAPVIGCIKNRSIKIVSRKRCSQPSPDFLLPETNTDPLLLCVAWWHHTFRSVVCLHPFLMRGTLHTAPWRR